MSGRRKKTVIIKPNIECRVKLENGKLCPRRDKVKCPFHGKIIPRDEFGVPIDLIERMTETNQRKRQTETPNLEPLATVSKAKKKKTTSAKQRLASKLKIKR